MEDTEEEKPFQRFAKPWSWLVIPGVLLEGIQQIAEALASVCEIWSTLIMAHINHKEDQKEFARKATFELETLTKDG